MKKTLIVMVALMAVLSVALGCAPKPDVEKQLADQMIHKANDARQKFPQVAEANCPKCGEYVENAKKTFDEALLADTKGNKKKAKELYQESYKKAEMAYKQVTSSRCAPGSDLGSAEFGEVNDDMVTTSAFGEVRDRFGAKAPSCCPTPKNSGCGCNTCNT
jgi:hypothetical protein